MLTCMDLCSSFACHEWIYLVRLIASFSGKHVSSRRHLTFSEPSFSFVAQNEHLFPLLWIVQTQRAGNLKDSDSKMCSIATISLIPLPIPSPECESDSCGAQVKQ